VIETALINLILADTTTTDIIGTRIRPFADTNVVQKPALTYWRKTTARPFTNDGPTGQGITSFQLDAWGGSATQCWQILDAIRVALDGISGTFSDTKIDFIHVTDQSDQINTPVRPGSQKPIQRATMELDISYQETLRAIVTGDDFDTEFSSAFG
jgi:hypothetical protein